MVAPVTPPPLLDAQPDILLRSVFCLVGWLVGCFGCCDTAGGFLVWFGEMGGLTMSFWLTSHSDTPTSAFWCRD